MAEETEKKDWKTTVSGWASLIVAVAVAIVALCNGDSVDTNSILVACAAVGIGIPAWLTGLFAKDSTKKVEETKEEEKKEEK